MSYDLKLKDKVAIITGGGQGMGRAIALTLGGTGMHVVVADKNSTTAEQVAGEVRALGVQALPMHVDVTDQLATERMVQTTLERFGQIDVLVNNAGFITWKKFADLTPEEWQLNIDVNLNGVFYCTRATIGHMIQRRAGRIINISSDSAKVGEAGTGAYAAAKAGVMTLTKVLARELGRYDITVNAICPGMVDTPMAAGTPLGQLSPEKRAQMIKLSFPLGRVAQPQDIADTVLFLASDGAKYITGQAISVDGGYVTA
ncbi:MAG: SDR family oxidoreductase [Chloroflexota bacterium]|nr:MAG: SDR family oxidoreductase [Chloroflexota bacterium]